jgi:hypothetical protein
MQQYLLLSLICFFTKNVQYYMRRQLTSLILIGSIIQKYNTYITKKWKLLLVVEFTWQILFLQNRLILDLLSSVVLFVCILTIRPLQSFHRLLFYSLLTTHTFLFFNSSIIIFLSPRSIYRISSYQFCLFHLYERDFFAVRESHNSRHWSLIIHLWFHRS